MAASMSTVKEVVEVITKHTDDTSSPGHRQSLGGESVNGADRT